MEKEENKIYHVNFCVSILPILVPELFLRNIYMQWKIKINSFLIHKITIMSLGILGMAMKYYTLSINADSKLIYLV